MKRTYLLICVFISLIGLPNVRGQSIGPSTLNATGGTGIIGSNEFDWSIGEMTMVSTFTGSAIIVTQGVLQPDDYATGIAGISLSDNLQVFPNPSSSIVNIQFKSSKDGTLKYKLMDITGRLIITQSAAIKQGINTAQLDISAIASATYMLEVSFIDQNAVTETTSYKIQKLQ